MTRHVTLDEAVGIVKGGGLVVYPTETVYGIGADPFDRAAIARVHAVKGTRPGTPITIAVSTMVMARRVARVGGREEVLRRYLPGPFTFILPAASPDLEWDGTVGLRMPDCHIALRLIDRTGPITSTSANRHGGRPPITVEEVDLDLPVLPGRRSRYGMGSAIVDLTGKEPRVVREGPVGFETGSP